MQKMRPTLPNKRIGETHYGFRIRFKDATVVPGSLAEPKLSAYFEVA
jgi:hypothetical protein